MNDPSSRRYPIEKQRYRESVGKLLPHRIGQILEELGFKTQINPIQSNGVDLIVFNDKNIVLVAEILNWSIRSHIPSKRIHSITENLYEYDCKRLLIYTTMANDYTLSSIREAGISILKLEYQIQPKMFFNFFKAKNQITARAIDSRQARYYIKQKILDYLKSIGLDPFVA